MSSSSCRLGRLAAHLWALPATLIGLSFASAARWGGARWTTVRGHLEVCGPGARHILDALSPPGRVLVSMTLGHVVLARDAEALTRCRRHEAAHVRQFERWGAFLLPAYLAASAVAAWRGRDPYLGNRFEALARR